MKITRLLSIIFIFSLTASAFARKPAVEDFVGVEPEGYQKTPQGTEVLFDFGSKLEPVKMENTTNPNSSSKVDIDAFSTFILFAFATLPFLMWYGINQSIKESKAVNNAQVPPKAVAKDNSNVESLDDYRNTEADEEDKLAS